MDKKTVSGNNRRRKLIIDKQVQSRIVWRVTWVPLSCLLLASAILAYLCEEVRRGTAAAGVEAPSVSMAFLFAEFFVMACGLLLMRNAIVISNRLAGPMYRFRKTFEAFKAGDLEVRNHLRGYDFLEPTQVDINDFLDWVAPIVRESDVFSESDDEAGRTTPQSAADGVDGSVDPGPSDSTPPEARPLAR